MSCSKVRKAECLKMAHCSWDKRCISAKPKQIDPIKQIQVSPNVNSRCVMQFWFLCSLYDFLEANDATCLIDYKSAMYPYLKMHFQTTNDPLKKICLLNDWSYNGQNETVMKAHDVTKKIITQFQTSVIPGLAIAMKDKRLMFDFETFDVDYLMPMDKIETKHALCGIARYLDRFDLRITKIDLRLNTKRGRSFNLMLTRELAERMDNLKNQNNINTNEPEFKKHERLLAEYSSKSMDVIGYKLETTLHCTDFFEYRSVEFGMNIVYTDCTITMTRKFSPEMVVNVGTKFEKCIFNALTFELEFFTKKDDPKPKFVLDFTINPRISYFEHDKIYGTYKAS
jgi:hypothetical protein